MNCFTCERPAIGVCKFCGRGVCKNHLKTLPYVITAYKNNDKLKALVTKDVLFCNHCKPIDDSIDLTDLE